MSNDASSVLNAAKGEIGYCRWDDPKTGTKYGRWYAAKTGESWYGASGVAFCAMFVSFVFDKAGASCAGIPGAYTPSMVNASRGHILSNKRDAKPGDVVYFNWDGGVVDHVGIVERNFGSYIQTIEGNTKINGRSGSVGRRTRSWGVVAYVVRPNYSNNASAPSNAAGSSSSEQWYAGHIMFRMWQQRCGTYVDGIMSGQYSGNLKYTPNFNRSAMSFEANGQSQLVKHVQHKVGASPDGFFGYDTAGKVQQFLINNGYSVGKSGADHIFGSDSVHGLYNSLTDKSKNIWA